MGGGTFLKVGGHKCTSKNYKKFWRFQLACMTSQAFKYGVTTYTPYESLNQCLSNWGIRPLGGNFEGNKTKRAIGGNTTQWGRKRSTATSNSSLS